MIKVGCCGFSASMQKYFEAYPLVELNKTFYQYPRIETAAGWRSKAPKKFEFTVKAHQDITHRAKLKPCDMSLQSFKRMKHICKILGAKILLLQTPASFGPQMLEYAENFFKTVDREDLVLVWETRGEAWEKSECRDGLRNVLETVRVTHVTDPFLSIPVYLGDIAYFRLHGLGEQMYYYQYTDEELRRLKELLTPFERDGKDIYVLFNNLSMFEDGLRFKEFLSKGVFPKLSAATGLASMKEVAEKTRYPASKSMLLKRIGWKLMVLENGKQVRLGSLLNAVPSKTYKNVEELIKEVKEMGLISE